MFISGLGVVSIFAVQNHITDTYSDETKIASKSNVGVSGGQVKLAELPCEGTITFTYAGSSVTYGMVSSSGECWMDRNLGASRVATAYDDSQAFGDLFQWGRAADGHQLRNSATVVGGGILTSQPGHSNFIVDDTAMYTDWANPDWITRWTDPAANPCPSGWRAPNYDEFVAEYNSLVTKDINGVFASPLKLPAAGSREGHYGAIIDAGQAGRYWSSIEQSNSAAYNFHFGGGFDANIGGIQRTDGKSVRCIRN